MRWDEAEIASSLRIAAVAVRGRGGRAVVLRFLVPALLAGLLTGTTDAAANVSMADSVVLPCRDIRLTASYLAEAAPGGGPGFLFRIENETGRTIRLAMPVPSSAHWYARVGNRWMWRASAGRGGTLVNAERENGAMFAYRPDRLPQDPQYLTVAAHGAQQWIATMRDDPAIAYRPSCRMCNYPGEHEYQAVFAYAYLANPEEREPDLLRCGLRSTPVPMPPAAFDQSDPNAR